MHRLIRSIALLLSACLVLPANAFDLQGHRGARGLAPENTLPGFARAMAIGVHTLETDVGLSRDGVLVLSHDPALNADITRGPDGQWLTGRGPLIFHSSADELRRYQLGRIKPGSRYAAQFADQAPADGARLPLLDELFALVKKSGSTTLRVSIETKLTPGAPDDTAAPEPFALALVAAVRAAGMEGRSSIQSFDWRTLAVVQQVAPEIATVYLTARQRWLDNVGANDGASPWTAGFKLRDHSNSVPKLVHAAGGRIWSSYFGDLDKAQVAEAHALGLQVLAWTVNEPAQIEQMLALGVDGIISDRPDRVRTAMAQRGMALPPVLVVAP